MRIHLVTYATPAFRHLQWLLGASARANRVVDTVTAWTPRKLRRAGFESRCPGIGLHERGSGFWAWKPFIIDHKLARVPDGDIVFYCDVGRRYPYLLPQQSIAPFLHWMESKSQDIMPGVEIPWTGTMENWTKREAFERSGLDRPEIRAAAPIQASFSLWIASARSREIVSRWMNLCSQRNLISDDPSAGGGPEAAGFRNHRHDQSLLTLACLAHGIRGIDIGAGRPAFNERDPDKTLQLISNKTAARTVSGKTIDLFSRPLQIAERSIRALLACKSS